MTYLEEIVNTICGWINLGYVSLAIISTFLVLYGNEINNFVKRQVKPYHFTIRVAIYVLVCTFAYGMLTVFMHKVLEAGLNEIPNMAKLPIIIGTFFIIAIIAERKRHI